MAEHNTATTLSRRDALTGAGSAIAIGAIPLYAAAATTTPAAVTGQNTELLALGGKFDPIFAEWCRHTLNSAMDLNDFDDLLLRETGIDRRKDNEPDGEEDPGYHETLDRLVRSDRPHRFDSEAYEPVRDEVFPLAHAIMEQKATTREEIKIQLRAWLILNEEFWQPAYEDTTRIRTFIETICSFFGEPVPLGFTCLTGGSHA